METITVTELKHASFGKTEPDTVNILINGEKTNIWYRLPNYRFYSGDGGKAEAEKAIKIITDYNIKPYNGRWEGFDLCDSVKLFPNKEIVEATRPIESGHQIFSASGGVPSRYTTDEGKAAVIAEIKSNTIHTQLCKMIIGDKLSTKIGIHFDRYGYTLGFI